MQWIMCYGEDMHVADVLEDVRIANDIVQVPMQIPVCRTCGERYYDRRTVHFLEEVERQLKEGKAVLREVGKVVVLPSLDDSGVAGRRGRPASCCTDVEL